MKPTTKDPMVEATKWLAQAEADEAKLRAEMDKAVEAAANAQAAFMAKGDPSSLETSFKAKMLCDRAVALHHAAAQTLDAARAKKATLDRERLAAHVARDKQLLPKWSERLLPLHAKLRELDSALFGVVVDGYARAVLEAQAEWQAADERARTLGTRLETEEPSLEQALLEAATALAEAREAEGREAVGEWVSDPPGHGDWKQANMSAAERVSFNAATERARAEEERTALLIQGAELAAHLPPPRVEGVEGGEE